MVVFWDKIG